MLKQLINNEKHVYYKESPIKRYEDRYGQWLYFFKEIAETSVDCLVVAHDIPWSWVPLLIYLRCEIVTPILRFDHCHIVMRALRATQSVGTGIVSTPPLDRTAVEVLCGFRPETVDALYKIDMQWRVPPGRTRVKFSEQTEFIVTNNGSFFREEVIGFIQELKAYTPSKRKVVLVPCAADKPYPAPLHQAILDILPDDYYLAIATGVLGIVPEDMWGRMPHYDSGIPNQWRLFKQTKEYFGRTEHTRIIVYCDFYSEAIDAALQATFGGFQSVDFIFPPYEYDDYEDLLSSNNLSRLKRFFKEEED